MKKNNNCNQFALLLCATVLFLSGCSSQDAKHPNETPAVSVVTLKEEPYTLTTELPGRTRSYRVAEVRPQVGGIVLKRQFVEGSDVQAGQSLYQIDPSLYQAAYDSAKGDLAKAEANAEIQHLTVKRYKPLLPGKFVSKQDYDTAVANAKEADAAVMAAKASVENARINLFFTKVNSPISGRIGRSNVTEGALVTPSQPAALAAVNQLDPIFVDVTQSSTDYLRLKNQLTKGLLKKGSNNVSVELFLEDGSFYNLKGTLQFSEVTVDETTGSITLRAIFPNPNHVLLPGMFVRARVNEGINERAVLAPQQGITRNARGEAVALIVGKDNKVVERTLVTGQAIAGKWLIINGLKAGDRVIVEGQLKIKPGMIVKPEERDIALPKEVSKSASSIGKS